MQKFLCWVLVSHTCLKANEEVFQISHQKKIIIFWKKYIKDVKRLYKFALWFVLRHRWAQTRMAVLQSLVNSSTQWYQQVLYVQSTPYKQSPKTTCPDKNIINLQRKSREKIITLWCIWVHVWNVWKIPLHCPYRRVRPGLLCHSTMQCLHWSPISVSTTGQRHKS